MAYFSCEKEFGSANENIAELAGQINSAPDRYETEHNMGIVRSGDETEARRSAGEPGPDRELPEAEHAEHLGFPVNAKVSQIGHRFPPSLSGVHSGSRVDP